MIKKITLFHTNNQFKEKLWHENRAAVWTKMGYETEIVTLPEDLSFRYFKSLQRLWNKEDEILLNFYSYLLDKINQSDIFIHFGGGMIYPEIIKKINPNVTTVYHCADDPESSKILSKPVAIYYDYCAISNIAEIETYKSWGCKNVFFWPLGAINFNEDSLDEVKNIKFENRDIQIGFIGAKYGTPKYGRIGKVIGLYNKKKDMNLILNHFPNLTGYGSLWKNGYIENEKIQDFYSNLKFGINIHNSTGPINSRLYDLNAYGVCQICDNKSHLGKIYELDKEVIGFENINEAIEKINFLINNPSIASEIAYNGFIKFKENYTSSKILKILIKNINC